MNHQHGVWALVGLAIAIVGIAIAAPTGGTPAYAVSILLSMIGGLVFGYNAMTFWMERKDNS